MESSKGDDDDRFQSMMMGIKGVVERALHL